MILELEIKILDVVIGVVFEDEFFPFSYDCFHFSPDWNCAGDCVEVVAIAVDDD